MTKPRRKSEPIPATGARPISRLDLNDPETVWVDRAGRSPGYYCKQLPGRVDHLLLEQMKNTARELGGRNLRVCLHPGPDAAFHDMIILEHLGRYYRPHKHLDKGESFHIIEGSLAAFVFDDRGAILDSCLLNREQGALIYRVGIQMYHAVMPLSDVVIYHEAKPGPFTREGDSLFPDWAPDASDGPAVDAFNRSLLRHLGLEPAEK